MFANTLFNGDISGWNVSQVSNMEGMLFGAGAFNQDISGGDVSRVTLLEGFVTFLTSYNQILCPWGSRLPPLGNIDPPLMFDGAILCPRQSDPDFSLSPPGPFCFVCDE